MTVSDGIRLLTEWRIDKFRDPDNRISKLLRAGLSIPEAIRLFGDAYLGSETTHGNIAVHEGLYLLTGIITGIDGASAKWDSSNAYLGVGNSSQAAVDEDTGLVGASKTYKAMDGTYPQRAASESAEDQYTEWRSTFGSSDANYDWQEYTVSNSNSDSGKNLNRKVESKGTKSSGESWTLSLKITFA